MCSLLSGGGGGGGGAGGGDSFFNIGIKHGFSCINNALKNHVTSLLLHKN